MTWLQQKYLNLLSSRFESFKWKSSSLANCRCMLCGDSKIKKKKSRGYFYERSGNFLYFCHNCGASLSFENLLKHLDGRLYSEYYKEKHQKNSYSRDDIWKVDKIEFNIDDLALSELKKLKKISQLPIDHPAKKYVVNRKIPPEYHSLFRWCPNFMTWTNILKPDKFQDLRYDEGRIVIPYFDKNNIFFAYEGRILHDHAERYLSIVLNPDIPRIFGLNTVDLNKNIYAFEGPIDACFIPNSVAIGARFSELIKITKLDKYIVVMDNEPNSEQTRNKIKKAINLRFRVCIWPNTIVEKDINDMILKGNSIEHLQDVINTNTFSGLKAKLKLAEWTKR